MGVLKEEPTRLMKNSRGKVAATQIKIVEAGTEALIFNNIGIQQGDPKGDYNSTAICTTTPNSKPPTTPVNEKLVGVPRVTSRPGSAASPVLPSYPVGRGISFPFGQLLPKCDWSGCNCNALITWSHDSDTTDNGVLCLDHGLDKNSDTRDLLLKWNIFSSYRYNFISPEHEASILAFLDSA
jgi:hypothetical protein